MLRFIARSQAVAAATLRVRASFSYNPFLSVAVLSRCMSTQRAPKPLFDKILIANRGEIACRVMKTAKRLGIKTVAVYSEPDVHSKHVLMADEAVCVGPAASVESYLNMNRILEACQKTGAQAVHPGYGFLSENAKFCDLLETNGVVFIGPKADSMMKMGLKLESKKIAKLVSVNTIPGSESGVANEEEAVQIAKHIGYPVMIKASAGGGGKGMRIAWNDAQVREGFRLSRQEARTAFSSDTMLVEKYIEEPRHIEIQVLLDKFGNGIYLNERECSIQRRNQKVLEEAPSTFLDPKTRAAMGEQALRLSKAVNYQSAGTVEMLVDKHRNFYFLEMNTRLQVEHAITEAITGVDLVEQMIRIAAGLPLTLKQSEVGINGWALEARVYAEDPFRNFLPSIGKLTRYMEPKGTHVRCDSGILEGSEISIHYDPMICKVVTHGKDRQESIEQMRSALDSYVIRGVNHNIPFLRAILNSKRFLDGNTTTKFISEEYPDGFKGTKLTHPEKLRLLCGAVVVHIAQLMRDMSLSGAFASFSSDKVARIQRAVRELAVTIKDDTFEADVVVNTLGDYSITVVKTMHGDPAVSADNQSFRVTSDFEMGDLTVDVDVAPESGKKETQVLQLLSRNPLAYKIIYHGSQFDVQVCTLRERLLANFMPVAEDSDTSKFLMSPMPGSVASLSVKAGDVVAVGQELCVIEAMKMQNSLKSPKDGKISAVRIKKGDTVSADQILLEFESD